MHAWRQVHDGNGVAAVSIVVGVIIRASAVPLAPNSVVAIDATAAAVATARRSERTRPAALSTRGVRTCHTRGISGSCESAQRRVP